MAFDWRGRLWIAARCCLVLLATGEAGASFSTTESQRYLVIAAREFQAAAGSRLGAVAAPGKHDEPSAVIAQGSVSTNPTPQPVTAEAALSFPSNVTPLQQGIGYGGNVAVTDGAGVTGGVTLQDVAIYSQHGIRCASSAIACERSRSATLFEYATTESMSMPSGGQCAL